MAFTNFGERFFIYIQAVRRVTAVVSEIIFYFVGFFGG